MKTQNKKAQIEIIGLLVLVIIISIALFFVLSFSLNENSDQQNQQTVTFADIQAITGIGSVILETDTECGYDIKALAVDCATTQQIDCNSNSETQSSCVYVQQTIQKILDETLTLWGYSYQLRVSKQGNIILEFDDTLCSLESNNRRRQITPFSTLYGTMQVELDLCL